MKNAMFGWGLGSAAVVLIGAGLIWTGVSGRPEHAAEQPAQPTPPPDPRLIAASFTSADQVEPRVIQRVNFSFNRNDTLTSVLERAGADRDESNGAVRAVSKFMNLRKLRPGDQITAWMVREGVAGALHLSGVALKAEAGRHIVASRRADGAWSSHDLKATLSPGVGRVAGRINQTIYQTAVAQGATDQQVADFANIFAYDVDFQREIWPTDSFEIVYERSEDELGGQVKTGAVLYAALRGQAVNKAFYRFTPSDEGVADYYDETGQSARKFLMKTPINGARISSGFGNRMHPILGYTKLHKGTDFAAPTGTPIYAAGNGVVERAGPFSNYGNYIKIRHANGYETAYGHLSRYAVGMKAGRKVRQGEVIGYVGMTGGATGPHLHYELYVKSQPVNAMAMKLPTGTKLEGRQLAAFKAERARIDAMRERQALLAAARSNEPAPVLASARGGPSIASVALSVGPFSN